MMTNRSILLVDDDEDFLEVLMRRLTRRGMSVVGVGAPEQALQAVGQQSFHVAVVDRSLPGMDGCELLISLKALRAELQVIVLSGHADPVSIADALARGACEYLLKPCGLADLERAIDRALGIAKPA